MSAIQILDGGMGTELISHNIKLPNHIWSAHANIENPSLVYQIHKKYIESGSDYITTNTFRTTPRAYLKTGLSLSESKNIAYKSLIGALEMAEKARSKTKVKILGSIAPLEDCYTPLKYPGDKKTRLEFLELFKCFVNSGIDIVILETMNNLSEITTCLSVLSAYEIPVWVSLNLLDEKHILSGEKLNKVIDSISKFNVEALLLNCNSIEKTDIALHNMNEYWNGKWGIYPNLGLGDPSPDGVIDNFSSLGDFIKLSKKAAQLGASILGGCCGSNYKHIEALSREFKK